MGIVFGHICAVGTVGPLTIQIAFQLVGVRVMTDINIYVVYERLITGRYVRAELIFKVKLSREIQY